MAQTRSRTASRLTRDAQRLVAFSQALNRSGSRVEDAFWENQLGGLINKLLRQGQDAPLEAALEQLAQNDAGGYEVLVEQAETQSESVQMEKDGVLYDVLLVLAPIVAWTRYTIPFGPIPAAAQEALLAQLHGHVLAGGARAALLPKLISLDQMPRSFAETWQWLQCLAGRALGEKGGLPGMRTEEEDMLHLLADTRYAVAAVAAPHGAPLFRWQEQPEDPEASRDACLAQWTAQAQPTLAALLPGCNIECLLPDAWYVSSRDADRRVRPLSLRASTTWLEGALGVSAQALRANVIACGESRIEEYRVGFTAKNSNDVVYGCVWPVFGREEVTPEEEDAPDAVDEIAALLKECGVSEVRRLPGLSEPEFCEDCGAPLFPNPLGELVHAEMPEDAETAPAHFH